MLRKKAKTQWTFPAICSVLGGSIAYMQLGVAFFIHANIQPYVAENFFGTSAATQPTSMSEVYASGLSSFFNTYLVYGLCLLGMLTGLTWGKTLLAPETTYAQGYGARGRSTASDFSPQLVYFVSSMLANGCLLGASFLAQADFSKRFWVYAALMGFLNGLFSGVAYQAPMLACQLFLPDRKRLVGGILLFGLACGVVLYSGLTAHWATIGCSAASDESGTTCTVDLTHVLRNLFYCMLGHTVVASILLQSPRQGQLNTQDIRTLQANLLNLHQLPQSSPNSESVSNFRDNVSRLSADYQNEEILERYRQARGSCSFVWLIILMALSLIPSFIMLGGFKFVLYMAITGRSSQGIESMQDIDKNLTILGMFGALTLYIGRQLFAVLADKNFFEVKTLLSLVLMLQYVMLSLVYFEKGLNDETVACTLYLITSFVYGSVTSLMPILCSQVFGPAMHANLTLYLQEQQRFLQRIQIAIDLYERFVFRLGTILAISIASVLIYFLQDENLIWCYSGLLVSAAYAIAAFNDFKRFQPDIVTSVTGSFFPSRQQMSLDGTSNKLLHS